MNDIILKDGDKFIAKKTHPCGGELWQIIKVGADYKIKCLTCGRMVTLSYDALKKCIKKFV